MAADFHNPIFPGDPTRGHGPTRCPGTAARQERGKEDYARMVEGFYDLITDFYEYGWGRSFHFAPGKEGASFEESLAGHSALSGQIPRLAAGHESAGHRLWYRRPPKRAIASEFGVSITGLNISEYQVGKCSEYNRKAGLDHLCSVLHGDFMAIPAEDQAFDAAYHIEALPHAPNKMARLRRGVPGPCGRAPSSPDFEWCVTPLYDGDNPEHRDLRQRIEYATRCRKSLPSRTSPTVCGQSVLKRSRRLTARWAITWTGRGIDRWKAEA